MTEKERTKALKKIDIGGVFFRNAVKEVASKICAAQKGMNPSECIDEAIYFVEEYYLSSHGGKLDKRTKQICKREIF
jgi:hypothetical protein